MFTLRDTFTTNEEYDRQKIVERIILFDNKTPTTLLEKKAAAINGHKSINPVMQTKIFKNLQYIRNIFDNDESKLINDPKVKIQINDYLKTISLEYKDVLSLPKKIPIFAQPPTSIPKYSQQLEIVQCNQVHIPDFEELCFKNKTKFRYLPNTNFAVYVYQNLLHYLNLNCPTELADKEDDPELCWRSKLAMLIRDVNFNESLTKAMFRDDTITFNNQLFDTSYVPKYDVDSLIPQKPISYIDDDDDTIVDRDYIKYHESLDVMREKFVPTEYINIFLVFPFKNGCYIDPSGQIIYLNLPLSPPPKKSARLLIENCNMYDIENFIDQNVRLISLDDAIYNAVYAKNIQHQSVALLILRRLVGDVLTLNSLKINIQNELVILSWIRTTCVDKYTIILPPIYKTSSSSSSLYVSLIKDIAQSAHDKLSAVMLCSRYTLPEVDISNVYQMLTSDAEKYVFFTLLLQEYNIYIYKIARDELSPNFGRRTNGDLLANYEPSYRLYQDTTITDRLDTLTQPLVLPTDVNEAVNICSPYKCGDLYKFTNPQLHALVVDGDVSLDDKQMSAFISLYL